MGSNGHIQISVLVDGIQRTYSYECRVDGTRVEKVTAVSQSKASSVCVYGSRTLCTLAAP
jgi:hypothetical protein